MDKNDFDFLMGDLCIPYSRLVEMASETGFIKRKRLIDPFDFLSAVCSEVIIGIASYNDLAAHIDGEKNISVSRQAIWKKVKSPCEKFLKKVLAVVITNKIGSERIVQLKSRAAYKRILVEDSTLIRLPSRLFQDFSGVGNGQSRVCNARIQCVYDLLSEQFVAFSVDSYTKNDLAAAPELVLQEGDLVLRDRGYLMNNEIQRHIDNNAHCIYRYKFHLALIDPVTEKPINLLARLKREKYLDMKVMLNNDAKTIVRLMAFPVSKQVADGRRMKAKKENKKNPQKNICSYFPGQYSSPP